VPKSRRYNLTKFGSRAAVFLTRVYARLLRPGSTLLEPSQSLNQSTLNKALQAVDDAIDRLWRDQPCAAA
ncbi:MAG: hypothetical protein AAF628_34950, partial [Planctomycetota bacterium]